MKRFLIPILVFIFAVSIPFASSKAYANGNELTLEPAEARVVKGASMVFKVSTEGAGDVVWSVSGNTSPSTKVSEGRLTFGKDEEAEVLTVIASLKSDLNVKGESKVTVLKHISAFDLMYDKAAAPLRTDMTPKQLSDALLDAVFYDKLMPTGMDVESAGVYVRKSVGGKRVYEKLGDDEVIAAGGTYYYGFVLKPQSGDGLFATLDPDVLPRIVINGEVPHSTSWSVGNYADTARVTVCIKTEVVDVGGPVSKLKVTAHGKSLEGRYSLESSKITVTGNDPCLVCYEKDGSYAAIKAEDLGSNGHSFTVPDGITEVHLLLFGDTNLDGSLSNADSTKTKAAVKGMTSLDSLSILASDVNRDGSLSNADSTKLKAIVKGMAKLSW